VGYLRNPTVTLVSVELAVLESSFGKVDHNLDSVSLHLLLAPFRKDAGH
jgi:hypothetical protein